MTRSWMCYTNDRGKNVRGNASENLHATGIYAAVIATVRGFNSLNGRGVHIFNFWHSGTLALRAERQSARTSKIKNVD